MAVKKLEPVALNSVSVLCGGKAVELRGFATAYVQDPRIPFSMRHPSPGCREEPTEPPQQRIRRVNDADDAARAGRPEGLAGVLVRRSSARIAGRAVLLGWPFAVGTQPTRASSFAQRTAAAGAVLPGRSLSFAVASQANAGHWPRTLDLGCSKRHEVNQARSNTAWGTLATSTWGTGD
jgi:hypothetical protein